MTTTQHGYPKAVGPRPRIPAVLVLAKAQAFANALARRRPVKEFSNRPVPPGVIEAAVRAALTAPGAGDPPPWVFVAVTDAGVRRRLRELAPSATLAETAPVVLAVFERTDSADRPVEQAVGVGVGFLLTTLTHAGLSMTIYPVRPEGTEFNDLLGRPVGEDMFMLIPVGYPTELQQTSGRPARTALTDVLNWR